MEYIDLTLQFDAMSKRSFEMLKERLHIESDEEVVRRAILLLQFLEPDTPSSIPEHISSGAAQALQVTPMSFKLQKRTYQILRTQQVKTGRSYEALCMDALRLLAQIIRNQEILRQKLENDEAPAADEVYAILFGA